MNIYTLKNFNQYNFTVLTLEINYNNKTYKLYKGMDAPIDYDERTTKPKIYKKIEELETLGFKEV